MNYNEAMKYLEKHDHMFHEEIEKVPTSIVDKDKVIKWAENLKFRYKYIKFPICEKET